MPIYTEDSTVDKNYTNLMIYVRYQINIDKMDAYLLTVGITPEIKYGNVYFLKRVYATTVVDIKSQSFIEKVFDLSVTTGQAPKIKKDLSEIKQNLNVYITSAETSPISPIIPHTPSTPTLTIDKASNNNITKGKSKGSSKLA